VVVVVFLIGGLRRRTNELEQKEEEEEEEEDIVMGKQPPLRPAVQFSGCRVRGREGGRVRPRPPGASPM
jgi:hypothetical protein